MGIGGVLLPGFKTISVIHELCDKGKLLNFSVLLSLVCKMGTKITPVPLGVATCIDLMYM